MRVEILVLILTKRKHQNIFVITFLFTDDEPSLNKIVKKVFKGFSKKEVQTHNGVLHAFKELPKTRHKVLNLFHENKTGSVITIYLNKKKVYTKLKDEKHVLYNYVTNILLDRVCTKKLIPTDGKINIIASRRETNKFLNENFSTYIKSQISGNHKLDVEVIIKTPTKEKGLQVVDMINWAIFRKYEHLDETYYNLFKSEIVEENSLFP